MALSPLERDQGDPMTEDMPEDTPEVLIPTIDVGDWIEVYGMRFQLTDLLMKAHETPRLTFKHASEFLEEKSHG